MTKNNDFPMWDMAGGNEMCFSCERSGSKEKMCSWIRNFDPIPGWVAVDSSEVPGVQSFKILRCPKFLDSPDDPGMTWVDYLQSCRGLVVYLYRKLREYRELFYRTTRDKRVLKSELKLARKEIDRLKDQGADRFISAVLLESDDSEEVDDEQQE